MNGRIDSSYLEYRVIIWGYPYATHTHSWIHHGFFRAFQHLGFRVDWLPNVMDSLPGKNEKCIFISATGDNTVLIENYHADSNWIIFDHGMGKKHTDHFIPFQVYSYSFANYSGATVDQYREYQLMPKINWATDLLPHEMEFIPYHYKNTKDVRFIGSWWFDNWKALEKAHLWSLMHGKNWDHRGKHIFLRYKKFVPEDQIAEISRESYLTLSIQGKPQCETGYVPCRLLKNMSYSVLGLSNNLFMANLFDEDEIIIDRDIFSLLDKAEKVVKDRKVDNYTRKALEKVKNEHTYINRIEQLFSYLN